MSHEKENQLVERAADSHTRSSKQKSKSRRRKRKHAFGNREIRFIEMFSGIGGFRLGLERANDIERTHFSEKSKEKDCEEGRKRIVGEQETQFRIRKNPSFRCVWANDNDRYACKVYRKNFGNKEIVRRNIKAVKAGSIPDHQLLTAGFPCQAFSVAGKRKGFRDTRGTLFHDIARVAEAKRPQLLLLENVKGLLSHDEGLTFQIIIESLEDLGYIVEWQVLNSKHFGVPQNRERVFVVGHLGKERSRKIFPIGQTAEVVTSEGERELSYCLNSNYWKGATPKHSIEKRVRQLVAVTLANRSRYTQGVNRTPLKQDEVSFALNSSGDQRLLQNCRIRRLTPTECERLQGFPDGWTKLGWLISETQRYKLLGNAVTVNVIEFLGQKLRECLT